MVLYASLGESSKTIGYELGISPSRVSSLLKRAMRKLGLRTRSHLVLIARTLDSHHRTRASGPIEGDLYYV